MGPLQKSPEKLWPLNAQSGRPRCGPGSIALVKGGVKQEEVDRTQTSGCPSLYSTFHFPTSFYGVSKKEVISGLSIKEGEAWDPHQLAKLGQGLLAWPP